MRTSRLSALRCWLGRAQSWQAVAYVGHQSHTSLTAPSIGRWCRWSSRLWSRMNLHRHLSGVHLLKLPFKAAAEWNNFGFSSHSRAQVNKPLDSSNINFMVSTCITDIHHFARGTAQTWQDIHRWVPYYYVTESENACEDTPLPDGQAPLCQHVNDNTLQMAHTIEEFLAHRY